MAFTQYKLDRSVLQARGIFNKYIYETDDTIAEVLTPNYFAESRFIQIDNDQTNGMGWSGGVIECSCSDGYLIGKMSNDGKNLINALPSSGGGSVIDDLDPYQVPMKDATDTKLIYSGATVDQVTGQWTFDKAISVPSGTVKISDTLSISEATLVTFVRDNAIKTNFVPIQAPIGQTGTGLPAFQEAPSVINVVAQPDDSQVISVSPLVIPVLASFDNETDAIVFRANGPMSNVRMTLTDVASGVVLKYLPDKASVVSGTGGMEFVTGQNIVNMTSLDPDSAGVINIGFTPVRLRKGKATTVLIEADNMDLLGNSSNIPYLENIIHPLFTSTIAREFDTSNIADDYIRINNNYTDVAGNASGVVATYLADAAADTVTSGQFTAGKDSVSNPTVVTDTANVFAQGDIIQIQESILNSGLFEVESHVGTLLTIRGVGTSGTVEKFTRDNFISTVSDAEITKVNVSILRAGVDGAWETGKGAETGIVYSDIGTPSEPALQEGYTTIGSDNNLIGLSWSERGRVEINGNLNTISKAVANYKSLGGPATNVIVRFIYSNPNNIIDPRNGEIYFEGSQAESLPGAYQITLSATATPFPEVDSVYLRVDVKVDNGATSKYYNNTQITYEAR